MSPIFRILTMLIPTYFAIVGILGLIIHSDGGPPYLKAFIDAAIGIIYLIVAVAAAIGVIWAFVVGWHWAATGHWSWTW